MCIPRTAVEALIALSGSCLLAYAVFGLVVGTIYDTEEPYKITFAERPVTFFLHVLSVATLASVLIDLGFNIGLWNDVIAFFRQGQVAF
jgi:hypothetical protein